ncbi:MAG: MFS family permease [Chloroflexi bacterium]|jgi:EmrB/QacA subfamily drug resistance transporter|nr:MAG: MFS family permease [Chloroflexota bacterium]
MAEADPPSESEVQPQTPPPTEHIVLPRRQLVLAMAAVMGAMFLASIDQTIVATATPRIISDLGGFDRYSWVTTAYLVASVTIMPVVGRLTDMYGRKWFYIPGIAVFLLGSALAGLSQNMDQLIIFRGVQGLGAGVMMANGFIAIGDLFPPNQRAKFLGLITATFGMASIIGPTLGGFITDALSWHWIFYINLPLGIPLIFLFIRYFPDVRRGGKHHIDYPGIVLLVFTVVPLLLGLSWGGVNYPWGSTQVIGALVLSVVMGGAFIWTELRSPEPIVPLFLFRDRIVGLSLLAVFLSAFGLYGGIMFVPLFFQGVLGTSATTSGSFLTPMMLGVVAGSLTSGQALARLGGHYKVQALIGLGLMSVGYFLMSLMSPETSRITAVLFTVVMGIGLGSTMPVFTTTMQNAVPFRYIGIATTATQFFRAVGGAVGLAVLGSFMVRRFASGVDQFVDPALRDTLPPGTLESITANPQALVNPEALERLQTALIEAGTPPGVGEQLLESLRGGLSLAITDGFLLLLGFVMAAFVVMLFVRQVPLRSRRSR